MQVYRHLYRGPESVAFASSVAVYGGGGLTGRMFEDGIANAATTDGRVLVSVFLEGGIDSLSVLFPAFDGAYYDLRPRLALKQSDGTPFAEDPRLRWHPSAAGLDTLHSEGKVSVMPAGLDKILSRQELADLVEFLQTCR